LQPRVEAQKSTEGVNLAATSILANIRKITEDTTCTAKNTVLVEARVLTSKILTEKERLIIKNRVLKAKKLEALGILTERQLFLLEKNHLEKKEKEGDLAKKQRAAGYRPISHPSQKKTESYSQNIEKIKQETIDEENQEAQAALECQKELEAHTKKSIKKDTTESLIRKKNTPYFSKAFHLHSFNLDPGPYKKNKK
jgi:hypothetical protein